MSLNDKSDCKSVQSFCALNYETVELMMDVDSTFKNQINSFPSFSKYSLILPELYNKIKEILINVKDLGEEGTRNPTQTEINTITDESKNSIIYYKNYNNILNILHKDNLLSGGETLISKEIMEKLKDYIKIYKFNADRCNVCNTATDCGGCQSSQSCPEGGGGENGCGCVCTTCQGGDCTSYDGMQCGAGQTCGSMG